MRRTAWLASGNVILEEGPVQFQDGHAGVRLLIQDTAGGESLTMLFTLGEDYLEISGIGDLVLLEQVISTFRFTE
jgi:hypothetical protein